MSIISNTPIQIVNSQRIPEEGPRCIPLQLDFTTETDYDLDLTQLQNQSFFSMLQTIFIDMTGIANGGVINGVINITVNGTNQLIQAIPGTQGYYSVLVPNPVKLHFNNIQGDIIPIQLINVPVPGSVWTVT